MTQNTGFQLIQPSQEPIDITRLVASGCPANIAGKTSSFVVTGTGGLPPNPYQVLQAEPKFWVDMPLPVTKNQPTKPDTNRSKPPESKKKSSLEIEPASIVEADSVSRDEQGNIVLASSGAKTRSLPSLDCQVLESADK